MRAVVRLQTRFVVTAAMAVCCLIGLALATPAAAQPAPADAEAFIRNVADEVFAIIRDDNLSGQDKRDGLRTLMNQHVAIDYIGRLSLGRHGTVHDGMSPEEKARHAEQMAEYNALFPEFIFNKIYDIIISKFDNATVTVTGTEPVAKTDIFVDTRVNRPRQEPILARWRVRADSKGELKVIDVRAEGVSLTITQREEFLSTIGTKGLDPLLDYMRQQIATYGDPAAPADTGDGVDAGDDGANAAGI